MIRLCTCAILVVVLDHLPATTTTGLTRLSSTLVLLLVCSNCPLNLFDARDLFRFCRRFLYEGFKIELIFVEYKKTN